MRDQADVMRLRRTHSTSGDNNYNLEEFASDIATALFSADGPSPPMIRLLAGTHTSLQAIP
jgi:hypothetical protein